MAVATEIHAAAAAAAAAGHMLRQVFAQAQGFFGASLSACFLDRDNLQGETWEKADGRRMVEICYVRSCTLPYLEGQRIMPTLPKP